VKTGIWFFQEFTDSRLRGNDKEGAFFKGLALPLHAALFKYANNLPNSAQNNNVTCHHLLIRSAKSSRRPQE
jgi:hypothetical protein